MTERVSPAECALGQIGRNVQSRSLPSERGLAHGLEPARYAGAMKGSHLLVPFLLGLVAGFEPQVEAVQQWPGAVVRQVERRIGHASYCRTGDRMARSRTDASGRAWRSCCSIAPIMDLTAWMTGRGRRRARACPTNQGVRLVWVTRVRSGNWPFRSTAASRYPWHSGRVRDLARPASGGRLSAAGRRAGVRRPETQDLRPSAGRFRPEARVRRIVLQRGRGVTSSQGAARSAGLAMGMNFEPALVESSRSMPVRYYGVTLSDGHSLRAMTRDWAKRVDYAEDGAMFWLTRNRLSGS